MSYSIVARCPKSGRLGIGIASYTMAIGAYCDGAVRPNVGAALTQDAPLHRNNRLAIEALAHGATPSLALATLRANDAHIDYRQIAIVDREGVVAAHTGLKVAGFKGQRLGSGFAVLGSSLASDKVLDAMVAKFESNGELEFDERLLTVLEAGRDAGGIKAIRGAVKERAVAITVWHKQDYNELDLRVDFKDRGAIAALRAMYADYKPTAEYYEERARHPRNALPAMEFADMLKKQQEAK
jgi:uncharacterized Ntn-hydrolase superfamily protein